MTTERGPPASPAPPRYATGRGSHMVPVLYDVVVNIDLSNHARRRLREKGLTVADVRNVLQDRNPAHPSPKKRTERGRAISGERVNVVYTEIKAEEFRIVSVITPDRR